MKLLDKLFDYSEFKKFVYYEKLVIKFVRNAEFRQSDKQL